MNNRSLSRGDAAVIGAAVLLFIASFLDFYSGIGSFSGEETGWGGWTANIFPVLPAIFLMGLISAGLIVLSRFLPQEREFAGMRLDQWGIALSVVPAWSGFWTLVGGPEGVDTGIGQVLGFIAALLLAGAAVATPLVPALQQPLLTPGGAGKGGPGAPGMGQQPYGMQQGQAGQGYGYPGGMQQQQQMYGTQQDQPGMQGQPGQPGMQQHGGAAGAPDPNFQPFWFAVPAARPLYGEDGSPTPVAELAPGIWYLAVEQRGQVLVAQTQDGRRGVLQDVSDIQRG